MKVPQPDLGQSTVANYVGSSGRNRKLKRFWGTEFVNTDEGSVEVIKGRAYYHPDSLLPVEHERLFRFLGAWKDLEEVDNKGLKSAWLFLNKDIGYEDFEIPSDYLVGNLNNMWWDSNDGALPENLTLTTTISIGSSWDNNRLGTLLIDPSLPKEQQAQAVIDNYEAMWANNQVTQEGVGVINKGSTFDEVNKVTVQDEDDLSPDDPWLAIVARYALRDNGIPCTIKDVEVGLSRSTHEMHNTIVVTLEIPYYAFGAGSPIVQKILADNDNTLYPSYGPGRLRSNEALTQVQTRRSTFNELAEDLDGTVLTRGYTVFQDVVQETQLVSSPYDALWVKSGKVWYLRAEVFTDPKKYGLGQVDLHKYLFPLIDTGYKKKKAPWWKKLVAVIIFIIAVVVTFFTKGTTTGFVEAAWAIVVVAFASALISLALSALGHNDWAMAFSETNKTMAPLVQIASIVLIFAPFAQAGTLASDAAMEVASSYAMSEGIEAIGNAIGGALGALISTVGVTAAGGDADVEDWSMAVLRAYSMTERNKLKTLLDENRDLAAEYDQLTKEAAKEADAMKGFMNIYAKPATADWSIYASQFDLPYERGGGIMAMGNIQKTTKQATRRTKYDDARFENTVLV